MNRAWTPHIPIVPKRIALTTTARQKVRRGCRGIKLVGVRISEAGEGDGMSDGLTRYWVGKPHIFKTPSPGNEHAYVAMFKATEVARRDTQRDKALRLSLRHLIRCARAGEYSQLIRDARSLLAQRGGKA